MQTTPLLAGLGVAAAAYGGRAAIQMFHAFKTAPPRLRQFYKVGGVWRSRLFWRSWRI